MADNIVEMTQGPDADCAFDQPCKFGRRVGGHAVYCHNDAWVDGPRKCHRTWYSGGKTKDEDCPGFQPNPGSMGVLNPTPIVDTRCSRCDGTKLIKADIDTFETCPRCMGDGTEPHAMELTEFEQDTLELATAIAERHGDRYVRIAESKSENESIDIMCDLGLVVLRSVQFTGNASVYLLETTAKGQAVMRANCTRDETGEKR